MASPMRTMAARLFMPTFRMAKGPKVSGKADKGSKGGKKDQQEDADKGPTVTLDDIDMAGIKSKMASSLSVLREELGKIRTGRADPGAPRCSITRSQCCRPMLRIQLTRTLFG